MDDCSVECVVIRIASNSSLYTRQIAEKNITTNVRNVRRFLKNYEHPKRQKLQQKSSLKQENKLCCLQFPEKLVYTIKK